VRAGRTGEEEARAAACISSASSRSTLTRRAVAPNPDSALVSGHFRRSFSGPNPYSADPVIVAELAFAPDAAAKGVDRCASIALATRAWFKAPASFDPCSTPLGIAQFLAEWTLAALNQARGFLHVGMAVEDNGKILTAIGFHDPELSRQMFALAFTLFNDAHHEIDAKYDARLRQLWAACHRRHPDYQAAFTMAAARAANVPYMSVLPSMKTWQFGWGARSELMFESLGARDSELGDRISREKPASKEFLRGLGIPMPEHRLVTEDTDLTEVARVVGWPCVVKPRREGKSEGVITDITDLDRLASAVDATLAKYGSPVMVESQVRGEVYRILVAHRQTVHVVRRAVAHVVGDGKHTVRALIDAENKRRAPLRKRMPFIKRIPLDDESLAALARAKVGLDEVLQKGRRLALRRIPMLTSGAVYTDVTAETHPHTLRMAEVMAASLGLENCGIDFVTTDITRSMAEEGAVLELNTIPSMRVHLAAGLDSAAVGRMILGDRPGRIPATLLVAPRDTLAQLRVSLAFGETTGWAIGGRGGFGPIALAPSAATDDLRSPTQLCAAMLVRIPLAERLFVAASLGEITRSGLPLDRFDTIVCLGVKPDAVWERVLREASGNYLRAKDLPDALRKCGLGAPAKKTTPKKLTKATLRPKRG
jgi:D-alanine-D-alanine ligase-like ATP-grasp enzyme